MEEDQKCKHIALIQVVDPIAITPSSQLVHKRKGHMQ